MFTKNDLISYLSDLEMAETNMRDTYDQILNITDDEIVFKAINAIRKVEERHKNLVSELRQLIIGKSITSE